MTKIKTFSEIKGLDKLKINVFEPSNSRKFTFDYKGQTMYINAKRLSEGNSKLVNMLIFSLPAVQSCLNSSTCAKSCYAMKAQRMYPNTEVSRSTNLYLYQHHRTELFDLIVAQISKTKKTTVRIHESGDFVSQEYVNFWLDIVAMFPNVKFYAYTKVDKFFDFSKIESLENFNLIRSFVEGKLNYGSVDYCNDLNDKYDTFICPASASKKSTIKCGRECVYCITKDNVCFPVH